MAKLVIFDLDGTLLDTLGDLCEACNHALGQCGFPAREKEEYRYLVGRGVANLCRGALPEGMRSDGMTERMMEHFFAYYNAHSCDLTVPYPGIPELLDNLTAAGIRIAIASNKYQEGTEQLVRQFFGAYEFCAILGQREGKPIKPDAGIIFEAIGRCDGVSCEDVYYCGDSNVDMETGRNAGVKTIGVTWGFRDRDELEAYDPWLIAGNPGQIFDTVAGSSK